MRFHLKLFRINLFNSLPVSPKGWSHSATTARFRTKLYACAIDPLLHNSFIHTQSSCGVMVIDYIIPAM